MFKRCILATDLSAASDQMVANLGGLVALGTTEIILAHCMEVSPPSESSGGGDLRDAVHNDLRRRAETRMETLRLSLAMQGFEATSEILYGRPAQALTQLARERNAELLIAGSRGASLAKNILVGSNAIEILRRSPVPVLLKRLEVQATSGQRHYRLIHRDFAAHTLYATDFSETAKRAFNYQLRIVETTKSAVTLLHVCPDRNPATAQAALENLTALRARLEAAGSPHVQVKVTFGDAAQSIVEAARASEISLLIMGTQGKGFVEEFFLGSESQAVIRQVQIPILVIPPLAAIAPGLAASASAPT